MPNVKVLLLSILALFLLIAGFIWSWWFVVAAVIIVLINQKELLKNPPKKAKTS